LSGVGTISATRWRDNWRAAASDGAVRVELPRRRARRGERLAAVRDLPTGTVVVLCMAGPAAAARCRSFAAVAGVELERQYLAFPSAGAPAYLVEDAPGPAQLFAANILVAPPRSRVTGPVDAVLVLLRSVKSWHLLRTLAPGRLAVGTKR
jgi:hypothetical protein